MGRQEFYPTAFRDLHDRYGIAAFWIKETLTSICFK